jgi:hypothetical protein
VWSDPGGPSFDDVLEATRRVLRRKNPERITHAQVTKIAQRLCGYYWICRFFTLQVEEAAVHVNGECEDDYALAVGLAIVKRFCSKWNGCPEEAC